MCHGWGESGAYKSLPGLADWEQQLPMFMAPSDVVIGAERPRAPSNKFDRSLLREELAA
jgi:hypothetical protein